MLFKSCRRQRVDYCVHQISVIRDVIWAKIPYGGTNIVGSDQTLVSIYIEHFRLFLCSVHNKASVIREGTFGLMQKV